jgi:N-methylhydantoinase B
VRADRHDIRPYGLYGRQPGRPAHNVLNPGPEAQELTGKLTMTMKRGDVFRHEQPGPGGWGDPLARDPERVLRDVRNEFVSVGAARDDYGVMIDVTSWTVDHPGTMKRREELRTRGSTAPVVQR